MSDKLDVTFNMRNLTARLFQQLLQAGKDNDTDAIAEVLARVVTSCPAEWGKPDDPETYKELPYFGEFQQLIQQMTSEATAKN